MRVWWSDETKINCLGSDGRHWVWKEVEEGLSDRVIEGTVKFGGGNVMMWGCMGWDGVGYTTRIEGRMDADLYVSIMEDELQKTLHYYGKTNTTLFSNRIMTSSTPARRPRTGSKTMELML